MDDITTNLLEHGIVGTTPVKRVEAIGGATSVKQDTLINRLDTNINNFEEVSTTVNYLGMEDKDGVAVIEKIDTTSGVIITYATIINNPTRTTYTDLWNNRTTNIFNIYSEAF